MDEPREYDRRRVFEYELPGEWLVIVGRTSQDNDWLSIKVAHPSDWWFHAKSLPGSHTLLLAQLDREPDRTALEQAAALAAYHSKARSAGVVPVSYTRAENVTKPQGVKSGTVQIRRESTLKVRPMTPEEVKILRAKPSQSPPS